MERLVALVFSCSIVLGLCVPSASGEPDIVKRMETCQEGNNTVSEQSETRSWFDWLSPSYLNRTRIITSSPRWGVSPTPKVSSGIGNFVRLLNS